MSGYKGGRPTKLTKQVQEDICKLIKLGNYIETAAAYVGISKMTLYNWMRRGRKELERVEKAGPRAKIRKNEAPYVEFLDAVEKALSQAEAVDVAVIGRSAKEGNWQAAAWRLERKFPERWGLRDREREAKRLDVIIEKTKAEMTLIEEQIKRLQGEIKDTTLLESLVKTVKEKDDDGEIE